MGTKIVGTGSYVPERIISNEQLETFLETSDEWIKSRTGIEERRISETENTSDLCAKAAQHILSNAGVSAEEVDFIVVATMTPDYLSPSTASLVQDKIGAHSIMSFDVNAACSGFVYALSIADKLMQSGSYRYGLVLGGEVMSKIVDWSDRSTAVLFGDGAGGVLLKHTQGESFVLGEDIHADGSRGHALTAGTLSLSEKWSSQEAEYQYPLQMEGRSIFDFAIRSVPQSIQNLLSDTNTPFEDVECIVAHQANERILKAIAKKLKVSPELFAVNISKYGNTSAASIPILLHELVAEDKLVLGSSKKIVLTGFGGGLTWGSMLIQL
ncbi:ketoacyl-ACP synthase III [Desemzia sp. RIT804]|uniref:beta-ketoacyl-ACP synthase III n=1 Tax=Desemzia sp. RIT 804 TaxID=2810209 RepID=UPI00195018E0|nr:beta-ketoacyl-ACP synthase III [Desemzia sp. RIT 804]MBM6613947.1 ketoacyl-ACP synthase III [Desemzia sp. RIT 804]